MYQNIAPKLKTNLDTSSDIFIKNKDMMLGKINYLKSLLKEAEMGGGQYHLDRLAAKGKMPVRERVKNLLDQDTPFLELSPYACLLYTSPSPRD